MNRGRAIAPTLYKFAIFVGPRYTSASVTNIIFPVAGEGITMSSSIQTALIATRRQGERMNDDSQEKKQG